jgi:hypothetical protein
MVAAWQDCEAELDARKANRVPGTPDLKMVVFMDAFIEKGPMTAASAYLKSVTTRRHDIMFTSGAWGTYNENDTWIDAYPSAFPEVVAFSAVNENFTSSLGSDPPVNYTAFSAPGDFIIWTTEMDEYARENDYYAQRKNSITVSPPLEDVQNGFWQSPPVGSFGGSAVGTVTAGLVDCGQGMNGSCADAQVRSNVGQNLVKLWSNSSQTLVKLTL